MRGSDVRGSDVRGSDVRGSDDMKGSTMASSLKTFLRVIRKKAPLQMYRRLSPDEIIPAADLPAPFHLERYVKGDEERWLELLNSTGAELGWWDRKRLEKQTLSVLLPEGGIFVIREGKLAGCVSACLIDEFRPSATPMYMTVLPEYRGLGLGQALFQETLRVSQHQKIPGMVLNTQNKRLLGIRIYLKSGFRPQLGSGVAGRRQWSQVLARAFMPDQRKKGSP